MSTSIPTIPSSPLATSPEPITNCTSRNLLQRPLWGKGQTGPIIQPCPRPVCITSWGKGESSLVAVVRTPCQMTHPYAAISTENYIQPAKLRKPIHPRSCQKLPEIQFPGKLPTLYARANCFGSS